MRLKQQLFLTLLCALPVTLPAQDELEPPDVDFFAAIQGTHTDYRNLGAEHATGARITLGTWMNEIHRGDFQFALEGSFNWMGESDRDRRFTETAPQEEFLDRDVKENTSIETNGLSLGARMLHEDTAFLRAGVLFYTMQETIRQNRVFNPQDPTEEPTSDSQRDSSRITGTAPYIGAGFQMPLGGTSLNLIMDYSAYWLESERVEGFSVGLSYRIQ